MTNCDISACGRPHYAKGFCKYHYMRNRLYGDPLMPDQRAHRPNTLLKRFDEKLPDRPEGECWLWQGTKQRGYGVISSGRGVRLSAHRVAYERWVGPIPGDLTIDHECHNEAKRMGLCDGGTECPHRACCNPSHLVARDAVENTRLAGVYGPVRAERDDEPE